MNEIDKKTISITTMVQLCRYCPSQKILFLNDCSSTISPAHMDVKFIFLIRIFEVTLSFSHINEQNWMLTKVQISKKNTMTKSRHEISINPDFKIYLSMRPLIMNSNLRQRTILLWPR